ncbi:uncharacterized protein F5147DRAFT_661088 [Suillus discolor]|uniref:Uncharacterized protein n=1 Tax=Suillus discolor TaxID=1912936 RepID=A0A9P7EQY3_9AGAM|nr:uncharacterized protein F5147DRAFT_661088 [Suillus discolor]KAG2080833.1 hypothetical protein F5147DRAFT_661088 [Suillus discolor]
MTRMIMISMIEARNRVPGSHRHGIPNLALLGQVSSWPHANRKVDSRMIITASHGHGGRSSYQYYSRTQLVFEKKRTFDTCVLRTGSLALASWDKNSAGISHGSTPGPTSSRTFYTPARPLGLTRRGYSGLKNLTQQQASGSSGHAVQPDFAFMIIIMMAIIPAIITAATVAVAVTVTAKMLNKATHSLKSIMPRWSYFGARQHLSILQSAQSGVQFLPATPTFSESAFPQATITAPATPIPTRYTHAISPITTRFAVPIPPITTLFAIPITHILPAIARPIELVTHILTFCATRVRSDRRGHGRDSGGCLGSSTA